MKVNFSQILLGTHGEVIENPQDSEKSLTLLDVCAEALLGYAGDRGNNAVLFTLWQKIADENEVDLKAEEIVLLKQRLEGAPMFTPLASGQAILMLERSVTEDKKSNNSAP
jgi:hypothetical protein